jgi:hypothetical protein
VKTRLSHSYENVKKELSNIPQLTQEKKGLDVKWTAFMEEHLESISKHGRDWLTARYAATKTAYQVAIKALEVKEADINNGKGMALRSALEQYKKDLERLKKRAIQIEQEKAEANKERKPLQTALYKAIKAKDKAAIKKADSELEENDLILASLTVDKNQNERDTNLANHVLGTQHVQNIRDLIKNLKADQETLLAFEAKTPTLRMPTL